MKTFHSVSTSMAGLRSGVILVSVLDMKRRGYLMYKQFPYEITFKLPLRVTRGLKRDVHSSHQNEAKKFFESSRPSVVILSARPLPSN